MKSESLYRLFLKDRVDAESVADFLTKIKPAASPVYSKRG